MTKAVHSRICPFCESSCGLEIEVDGGVVMNFAIKLPNLADRNPSRAWISGAPSDD